MSASPARVVLVTGLSGAGKSTILRTLEDLGFEAIDNPPLTLIDDLVLRCEQAGGRMAIGVDARTRGFDASTLAAIVARLRGRAGLRTDLVFASADETILLRRYTETRRRHPLAPAGPVIEGIAAEQALLAPLHRAADAVLDTTELPVPELRQQIERRFGGAAEGRGLSVGLISFAFPGGLPREADMVFDARFLRNPHYVTDLKELTGLDPAVAAYVDADPDFPAFFAGVGGLLKLLLPRFCQEGKKYATVAFGCTGGRHRSVHIVEKLAVELTEAGWQVATTHRELARADRVPRRGSNDRADLAPAVRVQAQEA